MGDKSAARSVTIVMAVIFAIIQTLEGLGVVPPGALEAIATCGKSLAGVLAVFGLRRAISANGLGVIFDGLEEYADDEPDEDYELTDEDYTDEDEDLEEVPTGEPFTS